MSRESGSGSCERASVPVLLGTLVFIACASHDERPRCDGAAPRDASAEELELPAVVALVANGEVRCSGSLVTPEVVVTAAHCVPPHLQGVTLEHLSMGSGSEAAQHPWGCMAETWVPADYRPLRSGHDVAFLRLAGIAPVSSVTLLSPDAGGLRVGETVRVVGYGGTGENGEPGQRHGVDLMIRALEPGLLELESAGSALCFGDSGGGVFVERNGKPVLAAVAARSNCGAEALATELGPYAAELQRFSER